MSEREQDIGLPQHRTAYQTAETICPKLIIVSKGIDLIGKRTHSNGDSYEEEGFVEIMKRNQRFIGVGPHMLDEALGRRHLSAEARPDALLLSRNFCLMEMVEFKSGRSNGLHRKVEGFVSLLERFREDPDLLPGLLNDVLLDSGVEDHEFPRIHIPINQIIIVRFVSPYPRDPIPDGRLPFKVRFSVVER